MNKYLTGVSVVIIVLFYFIGRWTAPDKVVDRQKEIDSLVRDKEIALRLAAQHQEMETLYRNKAEQNLKRALEAEKVKVVHHTTYINEVNRNRSYSDAQRDSAILAIYFH